MINKQKIIELFDSNLGEKTLEKQEEKLYWWILTSIESWVSDGKVASFAPFDILFSAEDNGVSILSTIGNGLPRHKIENSSFSPYTLFVKSIISLLEKKNYYIDNRKAWNFILNVIVEMKLNESISILNKLIRLEQFRSMHKEDGYDFFLESFNAVYSFGINDEAKYFYETTINYIHDYDFLSFKLLERLLEIDPRNSQKYIRNKYLKKALFSYRSELYKARGIYLNEHITPIDRYGKKYSNILKNDEDFIDFFIVCKENYLDFLLLKPRVDALKLEIITYKEPKSTIPMPHESGFREKNMREATQNLLGAKQSA